MEKENRVELDLKIIRKKHELKNIKLKTQYIITKEYHIILNVLKELLNEQKSIDKENFLKNLMSIDEFKNEVLKRKKKKALFNKLSKVEQDFIIQNEYDYLNAYADHIRTASRLTSGHSAEVDSYTLPIYIRTI